MRPGFSEQNVKDIVLSLYGLEGNCKPLPSYSDQNFLIDTGDSKFVFKIANTKEPRAVLDFQQQALAHVHAHAPVVKLPSVIAASDNSTLNQVPARSSDAEGNHLSHWVWMVDFLPGRFISEFPTHPDHLLEDLGAFMGTLDRALSTFQHEAMHRKLPWDLKNTGHLFSLLEDIKDSTRRSLARRFLERMDEHVDVFDSSLRTSVIHNDANDNNVLVTQRHGQHQIDGIIDFGDMLYSYTVGELAIASAYMILDKPDPVHVASRVLKGYHATYPLTKAEVVALFDLICLRLCNSVCMSARERSLAPDNEYLAISEQPAWHALEKLQHIDPAQATTFFMQTIGLE